MALNLESGSTYILINNRSGTVMDLSTKNDPNHVHGWHRHGQKNQQWQVTFAGQGWNLKSLYNGKFLAHDGKAQNGSKISVTDEPFLWHIFADPKVTNAGRVTVPGTTFDVDLDKGKAADGTVIHLWTRHNEGQQIWRFEKLA